MADTWRTTLRTNKRCWKCGKLMEAGTRVTAEAYVKERFYPVKGIMRFTKYRFSDCEDEVSR